MTRQALLSIALMFCFLPLPAQSGDELLQLVDSAYAEAMAGHLPEAIHINEEGLALVPNDSLGLQCEFYSCLLYCYHRLGDYEQALHYGELCLSYDETQGDKNNLSASLGNLAGIYSSVGKYDVAIDYLNRAIRIEEELVANDPEHTAKSLAIRKAMLGEVLLAKSLTVTEQERKTLLTKALQLTKDAYQIDDELGRQAQVGMRLSQLGNIYKQIGDSSQASECNKRALEIARATGNRATEVITLLQLDQYEEAAALAQAIGMKKQEAEACRALMEQYKTAGRYADALSMSERAAALSEAMLNEETERQLTLWQVRYDTQQKEQQLELQRQTIASQKMRVRWLILLVALTIVAVVLLVLYSHLQRRRKREIEWAAKAKDRYYSILSHDLRNPMVAQQRVLRMMYTGFEQLGGEEVRANIGRLLSSSDAQINLLSNLQEMALLDQGGRTIHSDRIDLGGIIKEVTADMLSVAGFKDIRIVADTTRSLVYADRDMIRTIVRNLLNNAIKFSYNGSSIEIGTMSSGRFFVRDHGVGMSKDKVRELLNNNALSKSEAGTLGENGSGMGILLCKELLHLNYGSMEIESTLGKGTTFIIKLPENK